MTIIVVYLIFTSYPQKAPASDRNPGLMQTTAYEAIMTQHEIKNRWTGEVLFSCEVPEGMESGMIARHAVEAAIANGANLRGANLEDADLQGADLQGADLWDANLQGANLRGADLRDANLQGADLQGANLRGADLRDANLQYANLQGADLRGANLQGADLQGADLQGADLWDANLQGANLRGADLRGADLWDANLQGADLQGANLRGAKHAPLVITSLYWPVHISGTGMMRIGCQEHSIERWKGFSDELISHMAGDALEFWNQHKAMLLNICDAYKHAEEAEKQEA